MAKSVMAKFPLCVRKGLAHLDYRDLYSHTRQHAVVSRSL